MNVSTNTRLCAVIGHPVGHSLSPAIHNAAYEALGLDMVYLAFDVQDVAALLTGMRAMPSFRGLSVTIPHKLAVLPHLDEIDPMAKHVGSVNTITNTNGTLRGSTTDGPGTLRAFEEAGVSLADKRVLFLGTGGAVRAVAFAVAGMAAPSAVTILGRTPANVRTLVNDVGTSATVAVSGGALDSDLATAMENADIVVNGTPLGMAPERDSESPVPTALLRAEHVVFDMVYRPLRTKLMRDADSAGCTVISGREMLIHQAALQFETWTGQEAPVAAMRAAFDAASA